MVDTDLVEGRFSVSSSSFRFFLYVCEIQRFWVHIRGQDGTRLTHWNLFMDGLELGE